MKNFVYFFFIIFIVVLQWNHVKTQAINQPCMVQRTGERGTCYLIRDCANAIVLLRQGVRPSVCGYEGRMQIVCCPNPPPVATTVPPPPRPCLNTIRHKKCIEYSDAVFEITQRIRLPNGTIFNNKLDRCGHTAVPLIVGGTPALPREFPHSALLGYQKGNVPIAWNCGGALISDRFVVTAGHCLKTTELGNVTFVKLGDLNTASENDDARPEIFTVSEIIPHPQYVTSKLYNDIALLRLDRQVVFNPYMRPLCLPLTKTLTTKMAIASGWGVTEWAGDSSSSLLKVTLDYFSHNECNTSYQYSINRKMPVGIIDDLQICAGSRDSKKDTCQGDSGGPLQIYHDNIYCMYNLMGVTSFGRGCGTANIPGVYTRVTTFVDWIESVVWPGEITVPNCEQS